MDRYQHMIGFIACILGSLLAAIFFRKRGYGAVVSIALGGLFVPMVIAFMTWIYPAQPESKMWAMIAVPVAYFWGILGAGAGFGLACLVQKARRNA